MSKLRTGWWCLLPLTKGVPAVCKGSRYNGYSLQSGGRALRELRAAGQSSLNSEMLEVIAFSSLSSSFCRYFSPPCERNTNLLTPYSVTRISHLFVRLGFCRSFSKKTSSFADSRIFPLVCKTRLLCTTGDAHKVSLCTGHGGVDMKFGSSFLPNYDVSKPRKVNESSLNDLPDSDVLYRLKQGFVRFKEQRFLKESCLFSQLAEGQKPKVMVIACADSRVCPTMLMGLDPGEVFTVRNVANLVPPCEKDKGKFHGTSAALEFAVSELKVEHIIVMGHRDCGGIRALMTRKTKEIESDFIGSWMSCALPAKNLTLSQMEGKSFVDQCKYCEQEAINGSLANLLTFPWIKEGFVAGTLRLHGWYYDFVEGNLTSWEVKQPPIEQPHTASFVPT